MPIRKELRPLYKTASYLAARQAAKERSGDACERCKQPNGTKYTRWDADGKAVQVLVQCGGAHLDQDPRNNEPGNVVWLCRACHLRHDAKWHSIKAHDTRAIRKDRARPILQKAKEPYQVSIEEVL